MKTGIPALNMLSAAMARAYVSRGERLIDFNAVDLINRQCVPVDDTLHFEFLDTMTGVSFWVVAYELPGEPYLKSSPDCITRMSTPDDDAERAPDVLY